MNHKYARLALLLLSPLWFVLNPASLAQQRCEDLSSYQIDAQGQCVNLGTLERPEAPQDPSVTENRLPSLNVRVVRQGTLPSTIQGDTEMIEGQLGGVPLGLITYTRDLEGQVCDRTASVRQAIFVHPLNPNTGLPLRSVQETQIGTDECNPLLGDGEFGIGPASEPILAYTSDQGVQLVQFLGTDWENVIIANHTIPNSQTWSSGAVPLSINLPEIQIKAYMQESITSSLYQIVWARLTTESDGTISNISTIWESEPVPISQNPNLSEPIPPSRFIPNSSQLHPSDPSRFIRADDTGIYEFSESGQDLAIIYDGSANRIIRTWMISAQECVALGLQPQDSLDGCPAVVLADKQGRLNKQYVIVKVRSSDGSWVEVLRFQYDGLPRPSPAVISHLQLARSAILCTGDGNARLYFLDGSSFLVKNGNVDRSGSEALYFSQSQLLGIYYKDSSSGEKKVSMVRITE